MLKKLFYSTNIVVGVFILAIGSVAAADVPEVKFLSHDITMTLDVPTHMAQFTDKGNVEVAGGWNYFSLAKGVSISSLAINGDAAEFSAVSFNESQEVSQDLPAGLPQLDSTDQFQLVVFEAAGSGQASLTLEYAGEFYQDVSNTRFSNEMVGKEVTGTIDEKGAYFSGEVYFYPMGSEESARFKLTANVPQEWESISDGNLLASEVVDDRKQQTWENPYESDGLTFFAAPFEVGHVDAGGVDVYCYFFPEDTGLMENYLNASADYIRMYSELIGPYPYERFTVVENFFPTGYGMPGWTLLGQQVLRLPFIVSTSLGHEVLHNWWGNSVFVDYEKGNWCEGITVYGADYRYKLMRSPDEARDYRKNILKQYVSYINEGNDFPLREFTSRSDPSTRTIGYNKAMMVFHMIEELIDTELFFAAWKKIYAEKKGQKVSWEDWIAAFEATSGKDLSFVLPEWVDRPGAPVLEARVTDDGELKLEDASGQDFQLKVPVRISGVPLRGPGTVYVTDTSVSLGTGHQSFELAGYVDNDKFVGDVEISVDPDYHIFRKLYPEEVEPVISAILGNEDKRFICEFASIEPNHSFREFGLNMTGDSVEFADESDADTLTESYAIVLGTPLPEYLAGFVTLIDDSVTIAGTTYPKEGHTFILTGQDWRGFEKYIYIMSTDYASLPRIGQLIPHYGKYSYLVFKGAKNVGKGQWEPESSPLKIKLTQSTTEGKE